jgi:hypothetical protein
MTDIAAVSMLTQSSILEYKKTSTETKEDKSL